MPYSFRRLKADLELGDFVKVQKVLTRMAVKQQDFSATIGEAKAGDLIFVDPPYFENGRTIFSRYNPVYFDDNAQARLAKCLEMAESKGAVWVLTNGSLQQVKLHFPGGNVFALPRYSSIAASVECRGRTYEYIVLSNADGLTDLRKALTVRFRKV